MPFPTEPIGSIPRPRELVEIVRERETTPEEFDQLYAYEAMFWDTLAEGIA